MLATSTDSPIKAEERCDRCGAQARVRATFANGQLSFCGHHAREVKESLKEKALNISDPEGFIYG